jgi:tetratricopeptide (TPR) repeat protein
MTEGVAALSRYVADRARNPGIGLDERATNRLGYDLKNRKKLAEAVEVFKLNIKDHPKSGNTYDSLAETYLEMGEKALALEFYKKAIEAEPNYPNAAEARKIIEDLEKPTKN